LYCNYKFYVLSSSQEIENKGIKQMAKTTPPTAAQALEMIVKEHARASDNPFINVHSECTKRLTLMMCIDAFGDADISHFLRAFLKFEIASVPENWTEDDATQIEDAVDAMRDLVEQIADVGSHTISHILGKAA